jgi:hypothetical protein
MALQLTLSCDLDKSQSGPTLIHSTGVQDYKIPPEVVCLHKRSNDLIRIRRFDFFIDSNFTRKYF